MSQKVLSIFGDECFPKWGGGMSLNKRDKAINHIIEFFKKTAPELVYIMPTKRTASVVPLICKAAKIPYILVSPYPGFYNGVSKLDKTCIKQAVDSAKTIIIIHDGKPDNAKHAEKIWKEAVEFMCKVPTAIVFMYSSETSRDYKAFVEDICTKNEDDKILWELIYDYSG